VVQSGTTQQFLVMKGLEYDAIKRTDRGRRRNLGQDLQLMGHPDAHNRAAMIRWLWRYRHRDLFLANRAVASDAQLYLFGEQEEASHSLAYGLGEARKVCSDLRFPHANYAAFAQVAYEVDPLAAASFTEALSTGLGFNGPRDPRLAFRDRCHAEKNTARPPIWSEYAAWLHSTWNLWRSDKPAKNFLRFIQTGRSAQVFPWPDGLRTLPAEQTASAAQAPVAVS
jgi:hypothetical protein